MAGRVIEQKITKGRGNQFVGRERTVSRSLFCAVVLQLLLQGQKFFGWMLAMKAKQPHWHLLLVLLL